jgi:hypothetical protein
MAPAFMATSTWFIPGVPPPRKAARVIEPDKRQLKAAFNDSFQGCPMRLE